MVASVIVTEHFLHVHWRILAAAQAEPGWWARLEQWVEGLAAGPGGVWSLFLLAFAESSFFPVPPDVLLMALCFTDAALESTALTLWLAAVCSMGSTLGGGFGYWLGMKGLRPVLRRLVGDKRTRAAERLLQRYDVWAVAAAGFTPIPYKVFTITSGALGVRFVRFALASLASRSARFFLVAGLCHVFGPLAKTILKDHLGWATLAFLALLLAGFYVIGLAARRTGKDAKDGERQDQVNGSARDN